MHFDTGGFGTIPSATVMSGACVGEPDAPTRDYAEFLGWYHGEEEWDFSSPVTSNLTLRAKWRPISSEGLVFSSLGNSYAVSDYTGSGSSIIIPYEHEGKPVTAVAEGAFSSTSNIAELVIPPSVVEIGSALSTFNSIEKLSAPASLLDDLTLSSSLRTAHVLSGTEIPTGAFSGCYRLHTVTLPDGLEKIGASAFSHCSNLTFIHIPSSVTEIGINAFAECTKLVEICNDSEISLAPATNGPGTLGAYALRVYSSKSEESRIFQEGDFTFFRDEGELLLVSWTGEETDTLTLPTVASGYAINMHAFLSTPRFRTLIIPEGVTKIGEEAFYACSGIITMYLPSTLTYVGYCAFFNCAYIENAYYNGTVAEWLAIDRDVGWVLHISSYMKLVCSDGMLDKSTM